jgi:hypothetical protein
MKLISHRGNLNGKISKYENEPFYLKEAISKFDIEIDVWYDEDIFLGHDNPQYKIELDFLLENKQKLWCHAKNVEALNFLLLKNIHCFWHQNDNYTLTSKNHIWVYPGKKLIKNCIAVLSENLYTKEQLSVCYGICSDYIAQY